MRGSKILPRKGAFLTQASDCAGETSEGLEQKGEGLQCRDQIELENKIQNCLLLNLCPLLSQMQPLADGQVCHSKRQLGSTSCSQE